MKFVESNMDLPWVWFNMSLNPCLTTEFIESHLNLDWDWSGISSNPCVSMEFVESHMDLPWDWMKLSENPNLTMKFVESHMELDWDWWGAISKHPILTMKFVESHMDFQWDWWAMIPNPKITKEFIEKHGRLILNERVQADAEDEWGWGTTVTPVCFPMDKMPPINLFEWVELSGHTYLTPDIIDRYHDGEWCWVLISSHVFQCDETLTYYMNRESATTQFTKKFSEALIAKACHPDRPNVYDWICDIEEREEMRVDLLLA